MVAIATATASMLSRQGWLRSSDGRPLGAAAAMAPVGGAEETKG